MKIVSTWPSGDLGIGLQGELVHQARCGRQRYRAAMGGAAAGRATRRCGYRLLRTYATHGKSKAPGGTDQPVPTPTGSAAMPSVASASTPTSTAVPIGKPLGSAQASAASAQQGTASAPGSAGAPHQAKAAATQGSGAGSIGSASKTPGPAPSGTTSLGSSTSRPIPAPATGSGAAGAPAPGQTLPSGISTAGKPAQQFYKGGGRAPGQGLQRQGQAAEDNSLGSQERAPQSDSGSASRGADAARVKTLQETVQVMKVAMADSAGEAAFSHEHHPPPPQDKGKAIGQIPQAAGAPAPPAPSRAPVAPQAAAAEAAAADDHAAAVQRQLGITDDLSPAALVRKAIERGEGAGDDWAEYAHRLRQAELDADVIRAVLGRVAAHHQGEVAKVQAVADGHAQRVRDAASKAQAIVNHFTQVLEEQQRLADAQRENELKRQAEYMAVAAAEAAVQERRLRGEELDKVRIKLNALGQAFSQRSQERHTSHTAHKLALGTFALESALCQGQPFEEALRLLARGCEGDDLVYAAIRALPKETAEQGIPTRAQLQDRWADVARAARSLAALPEGAGGPLSLGLASLAAKLKVSERGCAGQAGRQSGSVDSALAEAEGHLANGRPAAAGAALQRGVAGTAAAPVVQDWAEAAWARGVADQTLALLQAHATSQAASLS
ncbi:hypothetical protein WJX72_009060 [[Myrmecia] bisecta]|uniref:MICOS complex subunit MIC60 n=1 Tax=[Myrmecia] bisecta TaxID=41462 RepID=A0AAW1P640_9CHLO